MGRSHNASGQLSGMGARDISRLILSQGGGHCEVQGASLQWGGGGGGVSVCLCVSVCWGQGGNNSYQSSQGSVQELTQQKAVRSEPASHTACHGQDRQGTRGL